MPLSRLIITEDEPSSLLKDFDTYVHGLTDEQVILTPRSEFVQPELLYRLNQKMMRPVSGATSSTKQRSYRMLHLFYHLALTGRLFEKTLLENDELALKPTERLDVYEKLKPAEKYFFLLETLWTDVDWENLNNHLSGDLESCLLALKLLNEMHPSEEVNLMKEKDKKTRIYRILETFSDLLLYFSYFGLLKIIPPEEEAKRQPSKKDFLIRSVKVSLFGATITTILQQAREPIYWNLPSRRADGELKPKPGFPLPPQSRYRIYRQEMLSILGKTNKTPKAKNALVKRGKPGDPFFLPFKAFFQEGELQRTLPRPESGFVDGTYIFKVGLRGSVWRRIEISAEDTLLSLHLAIQNAFDFDDDHLYGFYMDGKYSSRGAYFLSPDDEEGPYANKIRIGELGLYIGQRILYLFDFGEKWYFQVRLEGLKAGPKPPLPRIIEKKGKSPNQYPDET